MKKEELEEKLKEQRRIKRKIKRTKKKVFIMNKPDALLCADLHIREDQPVCRVDNYFQAQEKKIKFILNKADEYNCPVLCAGDFFDKAKSSKWLEIYIINLFGKGRRFYVIPGNHDLPTHSLEKLNESSLGILQAAKVIKIFKVPLGDYFSVLEQIGNEKVKIKITHKMIEKCNSKVELSTQQDTNLILSGDNHLTFIQKTTNQLLVNPGSMMRMSADQILHIPCVFLYYANTNTVKPVHIPIEKDVVVREHIEIKKEYDERMKSYIEKMNDDIELSLCFKNNIKNYMNNNKIKNSVKNIIFECLEK